MRRECISTTKSMKRKHQNLGNSQFFVVFLELWRFPVVGSERTEGLGVEIGKIYKAKVFGGKVLFGYYCFFGRNLKLTKQELEDWIGGAVGLVKLD